MRLRRRESGVVADGMGFILQDRGRYFSLDPDEPNALGPRKRTSHTLLPAHMEKAGTHIAFGFVGGPTQPIAQMQFISNIVDFGMNIQAAMEAPRFDLGDGCKVYLEARVPADVREGLAAKGHELEITDWYDPYMGLGQAVMWDGVTGLKYGASSPRADGAAVPVTPRW